MSGAGPPRRRCSPASECAELIRLYPDERRFRSRVDMARFRFGEGEYKYFANPLPAVVRDLRRHAYPHLAPIASAWEATLGTDVRYPPELDGFLAVCAEHGQTRPTPLLLRYEAGGYNCLHQDLYGDVAFPLQMTCLLSRPGVRTSPAASSCWWSSGRGRSRPGRWFRWSAGRS